MKKVITQKFKAGKLLASAALATTLALGAAGSAQALSLDYNSAVSAGVAITDSYLVFGSEVGLYELTLAATLGTPFYELTGPMGTVAGTGAGSVLLAFYEGESTLSVGSDATGILSVDLAYYGPLPDMPAVPLPASAPLLGGALAAGGLIARRRRKKAS